MTSIRGSLLLSFADRYSGLAINILSTMILARLLTPAETGLYSVAAGIVSIAQELRDFGIGNYVLQEREFTRPRQATALGIAVALGCAMTALSFASADRLASFFGDSRLDQIIRVLSLNFILVAFASIGGAKLRRDMNFKAMLRLGIVTTLVHACTSVALAALGWGALGMAWASVAAIAANAVGNYLYYPGDILILPSLKDWRRVFDFGIFASGGYLLQEFAQRLPDLIIGRMLGFAQAGLYSRGNGLINLFERALLNAITPVAMSVLAELHRDRRDLRAPFLTVLGYTTVVAWPVLAMMAILALPVIHLAFGDQWLTAVPVARILCLAAAIWLVDRLCMSLFTATGAVRRMLAVQAVSAPVQVAALWAGARYSIEWAAAGFAFSTLVLGAMSLHQARRVIDLPWREPLGELLRSLAVTAVSVAPAAAVLWWHGITVEDFWAPSLAAGVSGVTVWLLCLFVAGHPIRQEVLLAVAKLRDRLAPGQTAGLS